MASVRTFVAIELSDEIRAALRREQALLGRHVPPRSVRWVSPDGIHLTLKFLGDTPEEKLAQIRQALVAAAAQAHRFSFTVGGAGCFPNTRQPRVVWVGLQEPTGMLARLQRAVEAHVAPLGFPTERRPFSPHLTLGRVQRDLPGPDVRRIGEVVTASNIGTMGEMQAGAVALIKSDLRPGGAVYTTLVEAVLEP